MRIPSLAQAIGGITGLVVFGGFLYFAASDGREEASETTNEGDDEVLSAAELEDQYTACLIDLTQTLEGVSETSSNDAVEKVRSIRQRLREVQAKAKRASPISLDEITALTGESAADADIDLLMKEMRRVTGATYATAELREALIDTSWQLRATGFSFTLGLQKYPEPENDFEKANYDGVMLGREALRAVLEVSRPEDLPAAIASINKITRQMREVSDRLASVPKNPHEFESASKKYQPFRQEHAAHFLRHLESLDRFGVNTDGVRDALGRYSDAGFSIHRIGH